MNQTGPDRCGNMDDAGASDIRETVRSIASIPPSLEIDPSNDEYLPWKKCLGFAEAIFFGGQEGVVTAAVTTKPGQPNLLVTIVSQGTRMELSLALDDDSKSAHVTWTVGENSDPIHMIGTMQIRAVTRVITHICALPHLNIEPLPNVVFDVVETVRASQPHGGYLTETVGVFTAVMDAVKPGEHCESTEVIPELSDIKAFLIANATKFPADHKIEFRFPANGNEIEFVRILYRPGAGFWVTLRRNGEEDHDTFMFPISMKGRTQSLKLHNNWREILVALKACVSTL